MKTLMFTVTIWLLAHLQVFSQSPTPVDDSTPIPPLSGIVTSFVDNESITIEVTPGDQRTFSLARAAGIVGTDGSLADSSLVTTGTSVTLSLMADGDELKVTRVFLQGN